MKYPSDFSNWTTQMVHHAFGLRDVNTLPSLSEWMQMPITLTSRDEERLQDIVVYGKRRVPFWSEGDIKLKMLGPLLLVCNIDNELFSTFSEISVKTHLTTKANEVLSVSGRPDLMIATGEFEPSLPYFCMQEYKPKKKGSDPRGQTLIALMAARQLNKDIGNEPKILYGAFSVGRDWTFLTLENNEYALSKGFFLDEEEDIYEVVRRFRALKDIINSSIAAN